MGHKPASFVLTIPHYIKKIRDMYYPYILVVNGQPMGKRNATGLTLRSFFKQWPKDRIIEIYQWETSEYEDRLTYTSILIPRSVFPISHLLRKMTGRITTMEETTQTTTSVTTLPIGNHKKTPVSDIVKYCSDTKFVNIKPIVRILKEYNFEPDVVYTNGADFGVMKLSYLLSKKFKAGCCLHYMDNWRETLYSSVPLLNKLLNAYADKLEDRSKVGIAISEKMADVYSKLYHHAYVPILNCVIPHEIKKEERLDSISFVYAGGLHLGRGESLLNVETAIGKYIAGTVNPVKLVVYTNAKSRIRYEKVFNPAITEFRDFLPHDKVNEVYDNADVLVHIESFDEKQILYTKYSMSTKIPEYLSSGRPILCYAPGEIAVSQYVSENSVGISAIDKLTLESAVCLLAESKEKRIQFGENGILLFEKNHQQNAVAEQFKNAIIKNVLVHE